MHRIQRQSRHSEPERVEQSDAIAPVVPSAHGRSVSSLFPLSPTEIQVFSKTVGALTEILNTQSDKIEIEKLRAIGQRNRKETEAETRKRKQQELQFLIQQKQSELQRLHDQYDSLLKIEQEQKVLTEKLSKQ